MPVETVTLTFENPVFHTYLIAASIMLLKLMIQPWITVQRMLKVGAGYRSPEDAKQSPINPKPREGQLGHRRICRSFPAHESQRS